MSFIAELRRRNVFRVGIAYAIVAWLILQVIDVVMPIMALPDWVGKAILLLLLIGLPLAIVFAWAYELTPDGIKREREVDRSSSITHKTGRKLDFVIIAVLSFAVLFFALDKFFWANLETPTLGSSDSRRSIAVLPFVNMSGDKEQSYFSDGISEEILNSLVRVPGVSVASRTSSFTYRGELQSIPEIAAELDVLFVLEGSVRKAGNQVRVTAQLIDAADDRHIWSNTYDRELADIFVIQSEIANSITSSLKTALGIEAVTEVPVREMTANMDAYDLYLKGHDRFVRRTTAQDIVDSIRYLEQAVALDPGFAVGWESLGAVYSAAPYWRIEDRSFDKYMELAGQATDRALSIDPGLPLAYGVKGSVTAVTLPYDLVEGMRLMELALQKDPLLTTVYNWIGSTLIAMGYADASIEANERCLEIDPLYSNCLYYLRVAQSALGHHDSATKTHERELEFAEPWNDAVGVAMLLLAGNRTTAIIVAHSIDELRGAPVIEWIRALENIEGDNSLGLAKFDAWANENAVDLSRYPEILAAFRAHDRMPLSRVEEPWYWLSIYKDYRASPAFKRSMKHFGIFDYWRAKGFPPQCRPIGSDDFECD